MTISPVGLYPTSTSVIAVGGQAVTLMYGPVLGGIITNPASAADQGIAGVEVLYVDVIAAASLGTTATTVAIQPGQTYNVPSNLTTNVSVNAATSGHKFSAITFQPSPTPTPAELVGVTNPCLQQIIPSYLYQQYANDDDLQAFVAAYNTLAQEYLDWLNDTPLAVYTNTSITGDLLNWVAQGLYGVARPVLTTPAVQGSGPMNTFVMNTLTMNGRDIITPAVFALVNDDIFKRILTWKLYKGDGKIFSIPWLKRRIARFLYGANGSDQHTDDTQDIGVEFSDDTTVTLTIIVDYDAVVGVRGMLNTVQFNQYQINQNVPITRTLKRVDTYTHGNQININLYNSPPNATIFKEAIDQGILDLPFQFKPVVHIL